MKPDWNDAPYWANYCAMDYDGTWYWFELEPEYKTDGVWRQRADARWDEVCGNGAKDSLEKRP